MSRMSVERSGGGHGQILPLFAILLIVLCGFAALAVDVSSVYSARRTYRSVADAAALAGAQDLYKLGTRALDEDTWTRSQLKALGSVADRLGGSFPGVCLSTTPFRKLRTCILTVDGQEQYQISVRAPLDSSQDCDACDPRRSIAVDVVRLAYPLSFARALGFNEFRIETASVAGLAIKKGYTIVTLRPLTSTKDPQSSITFGGSGTTVTVRTGDVGANGNMVYNGGVGQLELDPDFDFDYYLLPGVAPGWLVKGSLTPPGNRLGSPILPPDYTVSPLPTAAPSPPVTPAGDASCDTLYRSLAGAGSNYRALFNGVGAGSVSCWSPGRYEGSYKVNNGEVAILRPGLYYFRGDLKVFGGMIGGYDRAPNPGVSLVFEPTGNFEVGTNSAVNFLTLNAGDRPLDPTLPTAGTREAAPAVYDGKAIETPDKKPLTLVVRGDGTCRVQSFASCSSSNVVKLAGGASFYLAGVQYAPEDNISITGNSTSTGFIGQLWAWTVTFTGNSTIYQGGADAARPGVLRLDAACTTSTTPCPGF